MSGNNKGLFRARNRVSRVVGSKTTPFKHPLFRVICELCRFGDMELDLGSMF